MVLLALHSRHAPRSIVIPSVTPSISSWRISLQALGVVSFIAFQRFHSAALASLWWDQSGHYTHPIIASLLGYTKILYQCFVKVCEMQLVQTLSDTVICQKEEESNESINISKLGFALQKAGSNHSSFTFPSKRSGCTTRDLYLSSWALSETSPHADENCASVIDIYEYVFYCILYCTLLY